MLVVYIRYLILLNNNILYPVIIYKILPNNNILPLKNMEIMQRLSFGAVMRSYLIKSLDSVCPNNNTKSDEPIVKIMR